MHRHDVVPGDVIRLSAGDLVPADARLIESRDLYVQQAALTGESMPVEKEANAQDAGQGTGPEALNLVFLGTSVVSGTANRGRDEHRNARPRSATSPSVCRAVRRKPNSNAGIRQFGNLIMRTVFFLVLFILVVSIGTKARPV